MANIQKLDDTTFEELVSNSDIPVLVDFSAVWCGPCKAMAPAINDLAREYEGVASVYIVDIDDSPALSDRFSVRSVPTFMIFSRGKETARILGSTSRSKLAAAIEMAIEQCQ